jgi:hypothetical protein
MPSEEYSRTRLNSRGPSPKYHFYRVNQAGRRVGTPEVADCPNDDDAIMRARQILTGYVIEVCQADRIVRRVPPEI